MIKETVLELVTTYGYLGLFVSLVLGIVGLPIPDEILMTYCGYLVSQGTMNYVATLATAISGSIVGISTSYWLGFRFGLPLVEKYGRRVGINEKRLNIVNRWYNRFGKFVLVIGYFIPGIRHVTAFTAGMSRMPFASFAVYAYTGGLIWSLTFITLGNLLGVHWTKVAELTHQLMFWIVAVVVGCAILYGIWFYLRKKRNKVE
ncbi:alkaline phosphatase [Tumebacillus algifaecis]|uniref:Alkaline phosphatase n=1 Tax=Tumebacillus algifaecis TaxID=1214604 RepID=A0A223D2D7_9BACL|nr:DedA family protein [Tumebacillus algifaecis]ASS75526.1 alkaline phosphatase [Tumebacillus algifaecis]